MKPKLVVFDWDGTLVDTLRPFHKLESDILTELGGKAPDLDSFRRIIGEDNSWAEYYERFGISDVKKADEMYRIRAGNIKPILIPGVIETLEELSKERGEIGVVSMNPLLKKSISEMNGQIKVYFPERNIYQVEINKEEALREISRRLGISPNDSVYVGDMAKDVREAKKADFVSVGVANEFSYNPQELIERASPDYLIKDIMQFNKLFKKTSR